MPRYIEKIDRMTLPVVTLSGIVIFPVIPMSFEISDADAVKVCEQARLDNTAVFFVMEKDTGKEKKTENDWREVGTVARIRQSIRHPDGSLRVVVEGECRACVSAIVSVEDGVRLADLIAKTVTLEDGGGVRGAAILQELRDVCREFVSHIPKPSDELQTALQAIDDVGLLADFIACNLLIRAEDKQTVLSLFDPMARAERLAVLMLQELEIMKTELQIHRRVKEAIDAGQREYYLREQLKAIQAELHEGSSSGANGQIGMDGGFEDDSEIEEYQNAIAKAHLPQQVREKLTKDLRKLERTPYGAAESSVLRNYLDTCLEIPWCKLTRDRVDIALAKKILDRDHDGLEKVKQRILEFLAVRQLNPDLKNQILCLVGPPGTGKTSVVQSIAHAMKRNYVRVSLGGVRDEADIRGHRKTYVGAMPGRIVNALIQAGVRNPLILLDEIDKLTSDAHGDPASALLEVLDGEQNKAFRDHFVELPLDLSDCMFIATANTLETISRPLIDRMEIIELQQYTRHEKVSIAQNHLLPKQRKRHGLDGRTLRIESDAFYELIDYYTREAGVRNLEREIASICRKAAKEILETSAKSITVTVEKLTEYLGKRKYLPETMSAVDEVGVVNGLAYTEVGGELLRVEVAAMLGSGKLELTGSLGDVMKESAHAALTYIRSHASELGIDPVFYKEKDLHIHVPEGAVPKDGPSAGVTMATALASELSGRPVRRDIAMTGEITLRGRVLPIGGLREKSMAAYQAGIRTILIPADNGRDVDECDAKVRAEVNFLPCKTLDEVLKTALVPAKAKGELPVSEVHLPQEIPYTELPSPSSFSRPSPSSNTDHRPVQPRKN